MTDKEKIQEAINKLEEAIDNLEEVIGSESFNFVGSLVIFDDDGNATDDGIWYSVGDADVCEVSAECLLEDIRKENKLFNISLN